MVSQTGLTLSGEDLPRLLLHTSLLSFKVVRAILHSNHHKVAHRSLETVNQTIACPTPTMEARLHVHRLSLLDRVSTDRRHRGECFTARTVPIMTAGCMTTACHLPSQLTRNIHRTTLLIMSSRVRMAVPSLACLILRPAASLHTLVWLLICTGTMVTIALLRPLPSACGNGKKSGNPPRSRPMRTIVLGWMISGIVVLLLRHAMLTVAILRKLGGLTTSDVWKTSAGLRSRDALKTCVVTRRKSVIRTVTTPGRARNLLITRSRTQCKAICLPCSKDQAHCIKGHHLPWRRVRLRCRD